jgi:hypothetical protein
VHEDDDGGPRNIGDLGDGGDEEPDIEDLKDF